VGKESAPGEISRLRRCMNDLVSVLSLPAMWTGRDLSGVATVLLDGLVRMLDLDFAYLQACDFGSGPPKEWIRLAQGEAAAEDIGRALAPHLAHDSTTASQHIANPVAEGTASISVFHLGIQESIGVFVAGSQRPEFPTESERLLLQVATNQVAIALQEARRMAEQDAQVEIERIRAGAALRESERRLRELADKLPEVIWITALDSEKVLYCSPSFETVWGLKVEDLYREPRLWTWSIHPEDRDRVVANFSKWIGGAEINYHDIEFRIVRPDGEIRWIHERGVLTRDENGRPVEVSGISADVTAARQAKRALETAFEQIRALKDQLYTENIALRERVEREVARRSSELAAMNKELEAFAYSVSHDLRAPLRHMSGYSELLQKKAPSIQLDETCRRYITIIMESAKRMGNLIDDLLAFSRIGRAETQRSLVNLSQLVTEAVSEVRQEAEGRNIEWKIGALPEFYADRSMLRLVLVNLLSNAVKFTRPRSQAEIEIGCINGNNGELTVFVKDNGVGFDMKYVSKLFGVFQRLHPSDSFEGTGIGLATVQRIIHRHGGKVWAEGLVDQGATFYFSLSKEGGSD
jgi:PAS domain S-box-containing protein